MADQHGQGVYWTGEFPIASPLSFFRSALQFSPFARSNMEAGMWAFTAYAKSALAIQQHAAEFASKRLDKNNEFGRRMLDAKDTSQLLHAQAEYLREVAGDYVEGAQHLMERGAEVSREVLTPLKERAEQITREAEQQIEKDSRKYGARIDAAS